MKDYDIHINIKTGKRLDRREKATLRKALRNNTCMSVRDIRTSDKYATVLGTVFDWSEGEHVAKGAFYELVKEVRTLYPGAYVDMYWTEIPETAYIFETDDASDRP